MREISTERQAIFAVAASTGASVLAIRGVPAHAKNTSLANSDLPRAFKNEQGKWIVPIRVIAVNKRCPTRA